jgi:hypothetical protein
MVCCTGAPVVFANSIGCDSFRALAHLALCACAIFRREAADTPEPFNDSITEILDLISLTASVLFVARHEAAAARWLGFPWFPSRLTERKIV